MATPEGHALSGRKQLGAYLVDKRCDTCGAVNDLALVYRKRWWSEVALTAWDQTKSNLARTLLRSRITCRHCIESRIERIRAILESGEIFKSCQDDECSEPVVARGFCVNHRYTYMRLIGIRPRRQAPRGTGQIREDGYRIIYLPGHPNANRYGRIAEHRKVMADKLGRPLRRGESPHHKNGVRLDNRPENLELWVKHQPPGQRASDLVAWAREILAKYGDEVDRGLAS
jgi:hypothetical protein